MVRQSKDQWIEKRREKFRCPFCGEVVGCSIDGAIGMFSTRIFMEHANLCFQERILG